MKGKFLFKALLFTIVLASTLPLLAQLPGEGWERIGVASVTAGGDILSIAISPNYEADKTIFIGVSGGGLWRSSDRGETGSWRQCWGVPCDAAVTGIALPRNYQYDTGIPVFAVTNEGMFYRSDDDFETVYFEHTFLDKLGVAPIPCTAIVVGGASSFDNNIYVATWGYGVWGNPWGGDPAGWSNISPSTPDLDYCNSLSITSEATQKLWAAASDAGYPIQVYSGSNVWVSKTPISLAEYDVLTIHSSWVNPANMWAGSALKGMWRSMDYGTSWSPACDGSFSPQWDFEVRAVGDCPHIASDSEIWEGRSDGLRTSMDLGVNCVDGVPNSPVNIIGFAPAYHGTGNYCEAFVGTTEGLYRISCPSASPPVPKGPIVVDGNAVALAFRGRGAFMGSLSHGLFKSVDNQTMVEYNNFPNKMKPQIVAVCLHPLYDEFGSACTDQSTLFVGANFIDSPSDNGIYKSVDAGNSWTKMTGGDWPSTALVKDLAISPNYVTDSTLFAAVNNRLLMWDGSTWVRVAKDNNWDDVYMVALPGGYNRLATCSFGGLQGIPCHMVFVGVQDIYGSRVLALSSNNIDYFDEKYNYPDPTGIVFPLNYCTGSPSSTKAMISSSSRGVVMTTDFEFYSIGTEMNSGLPMNSLGEYNVNDIASHPDWIDDTSPTVPVLNCAVAVGSTANPKNFGPYHTDNAGTSWALVEPMGHALSVAFETRYPGESHQLAMVGFLQQALDGYTNPPRGSFISSNGGSSYTELTGYYSLPKDVYSSVAHERNPNFVFASSPSMGVFVSEDKGETFRPYNIGMGGSTGPCYLENGYGITMSANRRGANLDAIYVGTTDGIKSRYIYYDPAGPGTVHLDEESPGVANGWRHSTLFGGGNTSGYWERLEVVPNSSLNYPIWAVSPEKGSIPGQGFAALPAGSYEGWVFQNSGLPASPNAKGVRVGFESGPGGVQPLISGSPIKESVRQGEWDYYSIEVTDPNYDLQVFMDNDSNDPDLYVRYGGLPTTGTYDFRPYYGGSDETVCVVPLLGQNFDGSWGPFGDNPPSGWTAYTSESPVAWDYNNWSNYYQYAFVISESSRTNMTEGLTSPVFNIPSTYTSPTLTFFHQYVSGSSNQTGRVWFNSTEQGWIELRTYSGSAQDWITVDLSPYIGNTNCQVAFYYYDSAPTNGGYWFVDNVRVTAVRPNANPPYGSQQMLKTGTWYIGVNGYADAENKYILTATLDTGCTGTSSIVDVLSGAGKDPRYANIIPPDPRAPVGNTTWGTVNGSGVYRGTGTISLAESGHEPSAITWLQRNGTTYPLANHNANTIIQLPDTTLIVGCDALGSSDKGIFYSPSPDEGTTTWTEASDIAGEGSKNYVDLLSASNGDVLIAGDDSGTADGGVWLSGDKGRNWMRISQGFDSASQALSDLVADNGDPVSYYASTAGTGGAGTESPTGLWTRTITAGAYPTITSIIPDNGDVAGGTAVTITGTGFSDLCPTGNDPDCPDASPVVLFGDTEAAGVFVSSTSLTAVSPAHAAGSVTVKVRNRDTRESKAGVAFTFGTACQPPSGLPNNTAVDADPCADTGVLVSWSDPADWGDGGIGTRTFDLLRDGSVIQSGLSSSTHEYTDTAGTNGVTYTYSIRANNGCGMSASTSGASAADVFCVPPEVAGGIYPDIQSWEGETQIWPVAERAEGYYLYRVLRSELPDLNGGGALSLCKRELAGGTNNSFDCDGDDASSVESRVYFYLVTGYNETGEGSGGSGTGFTRTLNAGVCP